ncbi:MAG: hypothetical protein J2P58_02205 [Acidimicrobiaceae bacterium]|nr:hypothetical protein [Acidimicrobiaceae bacterium]
MTKTPFSQRPPREQAAIVCFIALSSVAVSVAQIDLHRRPPSQIRGNKTLWRVVSLNGLGALIYLSWGRIRTSE